LGSLEAYGRFDQFCENAAMLHTSLYLADMDSFLDYAAS
jgi:hypothetical protein